MTNVMKSKTRLAITTTIDFLGCWIIEITCKYLFASLEPKPMVIRGLELRRSLEEAEKEGAINGDARKVQLSIYLKLQYLPLNSHLMNFASLPSVWRQR